MPFWFYISRTTIGSDVICPVFCRLSRNKSFTPSQNLPVFSPARLSDTRIRGSVEGLLLKGIGELSPRFLAPSSTDRLNFNLPPARVRSPFLFRLALRKGQWAFVYFCPSRPAWNTADSLLLQPCFEMSNPYISLLGTAWRYARQERRRYVLVYGMFVAANITLAMNPLLYGWFIDALQREGVQVLSHAWMYAAGYLGLRLLEWSFHGPAHVMERQLAFNMARNYLDELYHRVAAPAHQVAPGPPQRRYNQPPAQSLRGAEIFFSARICVPAGHGQILFFIRGHLVLLSGVRYAGRTAGHLYHLGNFTVRQAFHSFAGRSE